MGRRTRRSCREYLTDGIGGNMILAACPVSRPNVTSGLHFNPANDASFRTVPATAGVPVGIAVIATDAQRVSVNDLFSGTLQR